MEEEERGISFSEILKVIFKKVWWVVGVTLLFSLTFALLCQFVYNPNKETYTTGFELEYPDSDSGLYPDGTNLRSSDFITAKTLNDIKEANPDFASVNVDEMVAEDDISISLVPANEASQEACYYVLTIKAKYFSSNAQAVSFIRAVAENPVAKINTMVNSALYNSNLKAFEWAKTYEEQITFLQAQLKYVNDMYDCLIEQYGQYYKVGENSLGGYRLELNSIFDERDIQQLNNELKMGYYVKDGEKYIKSYQMQYDLLDREYNDNLLRIEALKVERDKVTASSDVETFNAEIVTLVNRNSQITIDKRDITDKINAIEKSDKTAQVAFEAKLSGYCDRLTEATETFKGVRIAVYEEKSNVTFKSNKIKAEGGIHFALAAFLGALLGFILVCVIIGIVDLPKYVSTTLAKPTHNVSQSETHHS